MCPELEILSAFFDGEIGPPWNRRIESHVGHCPECAARLASMRELKGILTSDPEPDFQAAFERVRARIPQRAPRVRESGVRIWKQSIAIPVPVFAMSMVVILALGILLFAFQSNNQQNTVSVKTKNPGGSEMLITAPTSEDVEVLLKSLEKMGSAEEVIIRLPENSTFEKVGEPELLRAVDYKRNK